MRFGNEEDVSDRVRMIGFALAERALRALRTVSDNELGFQVNIYEYFMAKSLAG